MKYLDYPALSQLSHVLSAHPAPETRINARVEAYSIKPVAKDRKMFKEMEEQYVSGQEDMDEMSFSPEMKEAGLASCFGRLDVKESRKVHFLLVSTLNSAFPGYDFGALRPDHFTREISAAQVLQHLSTNLLGIEAVDLSPLSGQSHTSPSSPTLSSSLGASPSNAEVGNPSLYRILNEVLPMSDAEVYSWYPEPEYDPHVDPEENEEASDFGEDEEEFSLEDSMDIDIDGEGPYASWGQAGMELDMDGVPSSSKERSASTSGRIEDLDMSSSPLLAAVDRSPIRKVGGLLWSANYFFYSKRMKRVLFITAWGRQRSSQGTPPLPDLAESGSLPLPISASFTPPSAFGVAPLPGKTRPPRVSHHNLSNARPNHRRSKLASSKLATGKSLTSSTIPIRGLATPAAPATPSRLAASAPSTLSPFASPSAMRGTSGIKPRQSTARMLINAAAAGKPHAPTPTPAPRARPETGHSSSAAEGESSRVRKERSGSLTPGPSHVLGLVEVTAETEAAKGKRVRV